MMTDPTAPSDATALWRSLRRLIRREYPVLIALFVALICAEFALRWLRPDMAGLVYDRNFTGGHPVEITDAGFRVPAGGSETPFPRVLGLGDSTTYGTGVAAKATWPQQLADQINATTANAGFEGGSLTDFAHRFDTLWSETPQLDTVVLMVTGNMVSFTDFHWDSGPRTLRPQRFEPDQSLKTRVKHAIQSSAVWKAVTLTIDQGKYAIGLSSHRVDPHRPLSPLMAYGWEQPDLSPEAQTRMWTRFEERLTAFNETLKARDICLVVTFLPPRFMLSDAAHDNLKFVPKKRLSDDAEARIAALAQALNRPFVPLSSDLIQGNTQPLYIPADYTHLNASGHAIAAHTVAQVLNPILAGDTSCDAR